MLLTEYKKIQEDLTEQEKGFKSHPEQIKFKRVLRVVIPFIILEIAALIGLGVYLSMLPKNFCRIYTNTQDAVVYINDKKASEFRLNKPKNTQHCTYEVDVHLQLPEGANYLVKYTITCKYLTSVTTSASKNGNVYSMQVQGGTKTQLLSDINVWSDGELEGFNILINLNIAKI